MDLELNFLYLDRLVVAVHLSKEAVSADLGDVRDSFKVTQLERLIASAAQVSLRTPVNDEDRLGLSLVPLKHLRIRHLEESGGFGRLS